MRDSQEIQEEILNQPLYWVEAVNGFLYDAVLNYMEVNGLNRTKLAEHLGISKGRVSQILNEGDVNFSLEKVVQIALKVGVFPDFKFVDKAKYLLEKGEKSYRLGFYKISGASTFGTESKSREGKVISMSSHMEKQVNFSHAQ